MIFSRLALKLEDSFSFLKDYLQKANIQKTLIGYLTMAFLFTTISFIAGVFFSIFVLPIFIKGGFTLIYFSIFSPIAFAITTFILFIFYPINKASSRKTNIDNILPFAIIHMASIAKSGVPPYVVFKLISAFKEYGEVSKEFERIYKTMDKIGMDFVSATKYIAERTPSDNLRGLLNGFVSTTISGGDIKSYLDYVAERTLIEWRGKRQRYIQRLTTFAEIYVGLVISSPLMLISLLAIMNLIAPNIGGFTISAISQLITYIAIPSINIVFLVYLKLTEVEL